MVLRRACGVLCLLDRWVLIVSVHYATGGPRSSPVKHTAVFFKRRLAKGLREYGRLELEPLTSVCVLSCVSVADIGIGLKMLEAVSIAMGMLEKQALTTRAARLVVASRGAGAGYC